ncbi:MAG: molybdopterin-dependent oxidoreductase [Actinomycetota bacterium]|nr:molybdopterin-dependent oxidoreductase [Actinomycetota bacterium]
MRIGRSALTLVALTAVVTGCSDDGNDEFAARTYVEVDTATLDATDLQPPEGETVLEVTGGLVTNTDDGLELDLDMLERMRTVELELFEPFVEERMTFRGVPLEDVVELAGVPDGATTMRTVALNEYEVDIPLDVLDTEGVLLAYEGDGVPLALDEGGPIRIVFADDHPDVANESLWNWSLAAIDLR